MGDRYDAYFQARLGAFEGERLASITPFAGDAARIVTEGAARADLPYPYRVRPEALYFLTLCLQEMILGPAERVEGDKLGQLNQLLPDDVVMILETSVREAANRGDSDITGHAILESVDTLWPALASTSFLDWEL